MADENDKAGAQSTRRFRLPKLFADSEDAAAESSADEAPATGAAQAQRLDINGTAASFAAQAQAPQTSGASAMGASAMGASAMGASGASAMGETTSEEILEYVAGMAQELLVLREKISGVADAVDELNTRETTQAKVFDTLHAELGDYKKDFIYEHLKPVVRPLLFLYDSLEQFDDEIGQYERPQAEERRGLSPSLVRENVSFFRDQLVEALRVCEVTMMEAPEGAFNAKLQKAIGVENVEAARDNTILRVVRSGWFLNGQLLRPAEVIVGRVAK